MALRTEHSRWQTRTPAFHQLHRYLGAPSFREILAWNFLAGPSRRAGGSRRRMPINSKTVRPANCTLADRDDFAFTSPGFWAHADGQHPAGHASKRPGRDRELLSGANWCGRSGLLGGCPGWIATGWKARSKRRTHPDVSGCRSGRIDRAASPSAGPGSDGMDRDSRSDRVLLCRALHRCRKLAQ